MKNQKNNNIQNLNIVVAGKSGAGKSSLLNYLVGNEIFETGIGLPVTQEYFNIYNYVDPLTKISYNLFDTKGVEPDTTTEFENAFLNKIEECRDPTNYFKQIHTIYYCLSAGSKRIEPFEVEFLKKMNNTIHLVLVLTKCDQVNSIELNEFIAELKKQLNITEDKDENTINIVKVCSVRKETRKGVSVAFGKKEVLDESFMGLWNTFVKDYPTQIYAHALENFGFEFKLTPPISKLWKRYYKQQYGDLKNNWFKQFNHLQLLDLPPSDFLKIEETSLPIRNFLLELSLKGKKLLVSLRGKIYLGKYKIQLENTVKEILDFHEKLTGIPSKIVLTKSLSKIKEIENILLTEIPQSLLPILNKIEMEINNFPESNWFTSAEKKELLLSYDELSNVAFQLFQDLRKKLASFEDICNAELNQFGLQFLCTTEISQGDFSSFGAINSYADLSFSERKYYQALSECLSVNSGKEFPRSNLDFLRTYISISTIRAGQIEDFCRRDLVFSSSSDLKENDLFKEEIINGKEQKYADNYKFFIEDDGVIDDEEKIILEQFRNRFSISLERAGKLEEYIMRPWGELSKWVHL